MDSYSVYIYIYIFFFSHFEFEMEAAVFKFMLFPPDAILPVNLISGEPHPWERAHWEVICPAEGMTLETKWNTQVKISSCSKSLLRLRFDYPPPPPPPLNHFHLLRYSNIIPTQLFLNKSCYLKYELFFVLIHACTWIGGN